MDYKLTKHAYDVIFFRGIKEEWIHMTLEEHSFFQVIDENEVHFFKTIKEYEDRCLKVVVNPKTRKVITTYFDRNMRKKGCKNED